MTEEEGRLNVRAPKRKLEQWTRQAKKAGYSTLTEYVKRVLDGREVVVALEEETP